MPPLAPLGIFQNEATPSVVDHPPLYDFVQGSKTTDAVVVVVEAAISHARGLNLAIHICHSHNAASTLPLKHTDALRSTRRITRGADPFQHMVHVQLTALKIGAAAVTLRVRVQHAPLQTSAQIPAAIDTAWPADETVALARYGDSTSIQMADQNGTRWKVVLHPERAGPVKS